MPSDLAPLLAAIAGATVAAALTYTTPLLDDFRPWKPGDPMPVVAALLPSSAPRVVEDERGELVEAPEEEAGGVPGEGLPGEAVSAEGAPGEGSPGEGGPGEGAPGEEASGQGASREGASEASVPGDGLADQDAPEAGEVLASSLPRRPPGVATPLLDEGHRGMDSFYRALQKASRGEGVARVLHYGDSTIAGDGITSTVRNRLQKRFGNAGPGYLSAGMDPRWNKRADVSAARSGDWKTASILTQGGAGRYGLGGIVSVASAGSKLTVTPPKGQEGTPLRHLELWFQTGVEKGTAWASVDGREVLSQSAASAATGDERAVVEVPEGFTKLSFGANNGPVPFYGVVLETGLPGVTWEALGVVGVGSKSFSSFSATHLEGQRRQRNPDLVVVMLGGNEAGFPVLQSGDGSAYMPIYQSALHTARLGAEDKGCLVITPLDQGTRDQAGTATTKASLPRMVAAQQKVASAEGCAFWNAFSAMGGKGSLVKSSKRKPPLAWADLLHLSSPGLDLVGQLLADAIEAGFDDWLSAGGSSRPPVPVAPGPGTPAEPAAVTGVPEDPAVPVKP